jgi:hypothetical protein
MLRLLTVALLPISLIGCATGNVPDQTINIPEMPAHIRRAAERADIQIPKGPLNNKQVMALVAAAVKDGKVSKRALRQAVQFHSKTRSAYSSKKKRKG